MATARAAATRHLIEGLRNCLRGEAAGALLAVVEKQVARLLGDDEEWDEYDDWPDPDRRKRADEDASPAARAARRAAALASLDRVHVALGGAGEDGGHDPERGSVRLAAAEFGLDEVDEAVLLLVLRCAADHALSGAADAVFRRLRDPVDVVAALTGAGPRAVRARLSPRAPLPATGLLTPTASHRGLCNPWDSALKPAKALVDAVRLAPEGREPWTAALLGRACPAGLDWADFAHLGEAADLAARLLAGGARAGETGVHVLLYGPPGTGKTELAAALAARAGLRLFAVGEADDKGGEPSRGERGSALRLALALTRTRRDAALLVDEAEDVLETNPRQSGSRDEQSKAWLNRTLEGNPTPVVWTCNTVEGMDPAALRRMSALIGVGVPKLRAVRTRVWERVLDREKLRLPDGAPARLAARWSAAPAVCATAARAARLAGGGEAEVEASLTGFAQVIGGGAPTNLEREGDLPFDPGLVACDRDVEALLADLTRPGVPGAWSLLLTGPPGSGKTTLALHVARKLGLRAVRKRAADLSGAPGGPAAAVAAAFLEARAKRSLLLLDGIDDVAAERGAPDADPAALDALVAGLDDQPLPVLCTAEQSRGLDRALLRRFVATVRLRALDHAGAARAFRQVLGCEALGMLPDGLTPGDFAAVRHRRAVLGGEAGPRTLAAWLMERAEAHATASRVIGFRGRRTERAVAADEGREAARMRPA